jgi:2-polyprenyl-6-methoxyphenol hydroxylase-like FAD-dependent oxidoreductase
LRLAAAAQAAGASVLTGWSARVQTDGTVELRKATSGAVRIQARAIIVADGLGGSSLAERPEFGWRVAPRSRMGLGATITRSPVPLPTGQMVMLCGRFGYLGLVRLPTGEIDAAASLDPVAARAAGGPAKLCDEIVASVGGDTDALRDANWRGTPLLTRRRKRVESGNVYVVGDAAGYVEPFTGEGMTWAIRGSVIAAEIIDARLAGSAVPGAWATAHRREFASEHRRCGLVAQLARHPRILQAVMTGGSFVPSILNRVAAALGPMRPELHEGRGA